MDYVFEIPVTTNRFY